MGTSKVTGKDASQMILTMMRVMIALNMVTNVESRLADMAWELAKSFKDSGQMRLMKVMMMMMEIMMKTMIRMGMRMMTDLTWTGGPMGTNRDPSQMMLMMLMRVAMMVTILKMVIRMMTMTYI